MEKNYPVKKTSRYTVDVNTEVGADQDVSCVVTSDQPIVAERPMYFNYHGKWTGGHDVVGAPAPATTFYFAEGTTRDNAAGRRLRGVDMPAEPTSHGRPRQDHLLHDQAGTADPGRDRGPTSRLTVDVKLEAGHERRHLLQGGVHQRACRSSPSAPCTSTTTRPGTGATT